MHDFRCIECGRLLARISGFVQECDQRTWQRVGNYEKISLKACMNKNSSYEDHMIYRFE